MKLTLNRIRSLISACRSSGVQELTLGELRLTMGDAPITSNPKATDKRALPVGASADILKEADKLNEWFQQPLPNPQESSD